MSRWMRQLTTVLFTFYNGVIQMSITLSVAQRLEYSLHVKAAYQRKGPTLRGKVRVEDCGQASEKRFHKIGSGTSNQRPAFADVTTMNLVHSYVDCPVEVWEAYDLVPDREANFNAIDEQNLYVQAARMALGRRSDDLIVNAMNTDASHYTIPHGGVSLTYAKILEARQRLIDNNVMVREEPMYLLMGANQERFLLESVPEFKNKDFINTPPIPDATTDYSFLRMQMSVFTALPISGSTRSCFLWVPSAVGFAVNSDIKADIERVAMKKSWLVGGDIRAGACVIDHTGLIEIECNE